MGSREGMGAVEAARSTAVCAGSADGGCTSGCAVSAGPRFFAGACFFVGGRFLAGVRFLAGIPFFAGHRVFTGVFGFVTDPGAAAVSWLCCAGATEAWSFGSQSEVDLCVRLFFFGCVVSPSGCAEANGSFVQTESDGSHNLGNWAELVSCPC